MSEFKIKYKYRTKDLYHHYMLDNINSFLEEGERIVSLSLSAGDSSHYIILIESQEIGESK